MSSHQQFIRPIVLRHIEGEDLTSQVDGINVEFTTDEKFATGTIEIFLNGLKLRLGASNDYIINPSLPDQGFILNYTPLVGDEIVVNYLRLEWPA